jgi:hypothetical protein
MPQLIFPDSIAPNIVPTYVGQIWVNTATKSTWIAAGTSSVSDWQPLSQSELRTLASSINTAGVELAIDLSGAAEIEILASYVPDVGAVSPVVQFKHGGVYATASYTETSAELAASTTLAQSSVLTGLRLFPLLNNAAPAICVWRVALLPTAVVATGEAYETGGSGRRLVLGGGVQGLSASPTALRLILPSGTSPSNGFVHTRILR